jgi:ribosomal protein L11 methyltransferase
MSFYVLIGLPKDVGREARDALSSLVTRLASSLSFQGMEDWSVDVKNSRVLGVESEFHDLTRAGLLSSEMKVYFRTKPHAALFATRLGTLVEGLVISRARLQAKKDWMKLWRKHYQTQTLSEDGELLHIVPAWKKAPVKGTSIRIYPGQAFGTGTHATTQLCLRLLLRYGAGKTMMDFGAGTGVLAIAAAKTNGMKGIAVESDPVALEQCRKNIRLNRVKIPAASKAPSGKKFDLIFANVLAPVLLERKASLKGSVEKGGLLFLSGILKTEAKSFLKKFGPKGFALLENASMGDWAAIALQKNYR